MRSKFMNAMIFTLNSARPVFQVHSFIWQSILHFSTVHSLTEVWPQLHFEFLKTSLTNYLAPYYRNLLFCTHLYKTQKDTVYVQLSFIICPQIVFFLNIMKYFWNAFVNCPKLMNFVFNLKRNHTNIFSAIFQFLFQDQFHFSFVFDIIFLGCMDSYFTQ